MPIRFPKGHLRVNAALTPTTHAIARANSALLKIDLWVYLSQVLEAGITGLVDPSEHSERSKPRAAPEKPSSKIHQVKGIDQGLPFVPPSAASKFEGKSAPQVEPVPGPTPPESAKAKRARKPPRGKTNHVIVYKERGGSHFEVVLWYNEKQDHARFTARAASQKNKLVRCCDSAITATPTLVTYNWDKLADMILNGRLHIGNGVILGDVREIKSSRKPKRSRLQSRDTP